MRDWLDRLIDYGTLAGLFFCGAVALVLLVWEVLELVHGI
jgi:hypothetical protein